jgi:hypothetical protein
MTSDVRFQTLKKVFIFLKEMTEKVVWVKVRTGADEWPVLSGYVVLDRRADVNVHLPLKLEHLLQFPKEEWIGCGMKEKKEETEVATPALEITLPLHYVPPWRRQVQYVTKLGSFGLSRHEIWNYCFAEYDRYPSPLLSESFAVQRTGRDRWVYAIWYLKWDRFKEILNEEMVWWQEDERRPALFKDTLSVLRLPPELTKTICDFASSCTLFSLDETHWTSIVSTLCARNHPTNLSYRNNQLEYQMCFNVFITVLATHPSFCQALWKQTKRNCTRWDQPELSHILKELEDRPTWVENLTNVGFPLFNDAKRQRKE